MFSKIKEFLFGKLPEQKAPEAPYKVEAAPVESAPYKEPEPAVTTPIPLVPETVAIVPEPAAAPAAPKKKAAPKKQQFSKKAPAEKAKAPAKPRGRKPKSQP
jgi:hypothetical protein